MQLKFNITGISSIDKKLKKMERSSVRKIIRKAARAGVKIIKNYLRSTVPVDKGFFKKAMSIKGYKSRRVIGYYVHIDANKLPNPKAFYPGYLEHGVKGRMAARKYFAKAYVALNDSVQAKVREAIVRGVNEFDRA